MTPRYPRLTLRGRFALLAALGVAVAVIAAAAISYFLVAGQLNREIDSELTSPAAMTQAAAGGATMAVGVEVPGAPTTIPAPKKMGITDFVTQCGSQQPGQIPGQIVVTSALAISDAAGHSCSLNPQQYDLGSTASPQQVAVAEGKKPSALYDAYTTSGEHVRVRTVPLGTPGTGYAISSIVSLANMDNSLRSLAVGLAFAALGGMVLAGAAGFLVAHGALTPVRRLTRAAEHVTATDDLSVRLPVNGADELGRLGRAFNRMTKSLAGSRERQQRLIADAGHELRTPLTSLRTNVDLLVRSRRTGRALEPEDEDEILDGLDQQVHELSGLVTDLLELSRGTEGVRQTMPVALHESVGRAVDRARRRGPALRFDVETEPWVVEGSPTGLDRAVMNLLDNAVKFSPAGGEITVRLRAGELTVRDQGPGIDPADLPRVFERFYRADSARALPGSGLGLAIVAQVAEESGGTIALEPAPGGGTIARLTLPGENRSYAAAPCDRDETVAATGGGRGPTAWGG